MNCEKVIVIKREKLLGLLKDQRELLGKIIDGIRLIERKHVELRSLREIAEELARAYDDPIPVIGSEGNVVRERFRHSWSKP